MKEEILAKRIANVIQQNGSPMTIKAIASHIPDKPESTIRGRIYNNLKKLFDRVARGTYVLISNNEGVDEGTAIVVKGNGRNLGVFEDESIDAIVCDHPWKVDKSNKGTNRHFDKTYDDTSFNYDSIDFMEKARILKVGGFLVEILPAENEDNYKYLYNIKQMAEAAGINYYAKVTWRKGKSVFNTGRKSKNSEDIMFFVKGKSRSLRPDKQRGGYMSGTSYMLPTEYDFEPVLPKNRVHQAEKPVELYEAILEAITLPGEIVVDQYAGSGNLGRAAIKRGRIAILFELLKENVNRMVQNLSLLEVPLNP